MRSAKCIACGKTLQDGFILDQGYGSASVAKWVEGAPEKSFWTGVRTKDRAQFDVHALRCTHCGLLHLYAPGDPTSR